jgi:hypothetical protein
MTFRATRGSSSRRWRIAAVLAFLAVTLIAGVMVYDFFTIRSPGILSNYCVDPPASQEDKRPVCPPGPPVP